MTQISVCPRLCIAKAALVVACFFGEQFQYNLDLFNVDCKAEELPQGQHLVILMMNTSLEEDSQTLSVLTVYCESLTSSMSVARPLFF